MRKFLIPFLIIVCALSGCKGKAIPRNAQQLAPESLHNRQIQTRRFETANYETMLNAAAAVFQDLGFTLEESEFTLGVLVGSKNRDATDAEQIAGAMIMAALFGVQTSVDNNQIIRVSLVMRELEPVDEKEAAKHKLTPETLKIIQKDVTTSVASGLRKHFPSEISAKIAEQIGVSTAKTLTSDLAKVMNTNDTMSPNCTKSFLTNSPNPYS